MKTKSFKNISLLFLIFTLITCFTSCETKVDKLSIEEYNLFVSPSDFNTLFAFNFPISNKYEIVSKSSLLGDITYSYEYSSPDSLENPLYMTENIDYCLKSSDALITYNAYKLGNNIGMATADVKLVSRDSLFAYGDQSTLMEIQNTKGEPVGNVLIVRIGKLVYYLTFSGLYINETSNWKELVEAKLNTAEAYKPL